MAKKPTTVNLATTTQTYTVSQYAIGTAGNTFFTDDFVQYPPPNTDASDAMIKFVHSLKTHKPSEERIARNAYEVFCIDMANKFRRGEISTEEYEKFSFMTFNEWKREYYDVNYEDPEVQYI